MFFSGAQKLKENETLDDQKVVQRKNLDIVKRDSAIDIAILKGYPCSDSTCKKAYDIEQPRFFTEDIANKSQGTLVYFLGVFGEHTRLGPWPDHLYANVCYVRGCAGLAQMHNGNLIGDFAAVEITDKREDLFPSLKAIEANGGEINFEGCSGCGLWGINDNKISLLGVLLGKEPGNPDTEHKIRFTPIWKVLELLDSLSL